MQELIKASGGQELPKTLQSIQPGALIIPEEPIEIRANCKGGDLRFKIGSGDNDQGAVIEMQVLNYKVWQQIQIAKERPKLSDYVQFVGIANLKGKRIFSTVTMSGVSVNEAQSAIPMLMLQATEGGLASLIVKMTISKSVSNGNEYGIVKFSSRLATKQEFQDVIDLIEQVPSAWDAFRELPDYSKKEGGQDA